MTPELLREIAEQIVRQEILHNWVLYAVLLALGLLATVTGNWLSSYLKKRAETYATKADMEEVLRQVQATTRATEEVKAAVSHADWISREWRTTRRSKLEELLGTVCNLDRWLDAEQKKWIYKEPVTFNDTPLDKIGVLSALYFPELQGEVQQIVVTQRQAHSIILDVAAKLQVAQNDAVVVQAAMNDFVQRWKTVYPPTQQALHTLEKRAAMLMREIMGT
jgi:type II secretory pathway pseudopilin PulG